MPKRLIRFNIEQRQSKRDLFLKDPKADFIVILERKIFPLHKELLTPSLYFQELIDDNKKSVAIDTSFNIESFQQILGCFYGIEASFERYNLIKNVIQIISFLKVQVLKNQLITDMSVNFQEYGLFNLFYLSKKFKLKDIETRCIKELISQDFEQINYNRYDLFQLDPQLFIFILQEHEKLKNKHKITGLDNKLIRNVCQEYSKTNSIKIDVDQILKIGRLYAKQSISDSSEEQIPRTRKRNATWNAQKEQKKQGQIPSLTSHISQTKINSFGQKQNQLQKIRLINSSMQQKNNKLVAEINLVRSSIDQSNGKDISLGVDDIGKRLRQYQQKSKITQKKMEELKKKMLHLNEDMEVSRKAPKQGNYISNNILRSANLNSSSEILNSMAVLQKSSRLDSDQEDL